MNDTAAPTSQPKSKFSLGRINLLILFPFIALPLIHANNMLRLKTTLPYESYVVGYLTGTMLFTACLFLLFHLIAWGAFRLTKRNRTIGRWVFGVLALTFTTVQTVTGINRENQLKQQTASQNQLEKSVRKLQDSLDKQVDENGSSFTDPKHLNQIQGQLEQSVQNFSGDQRKYMEVLVAFNQEIIKLSNEYQQAVNTFELAGGNELEGVTKPAQLDERIQLIDHVRDLSETMVNLVKEAPDILHKRMKENGVPTEYANRLLDLSLPSFHRDLIMKVRLIDDDIFQHRRELLTTLKDDWGNWHYNEDSGTVSFDNSQTLSNYNKLSSEIDQLNVNLREAMHQLLTAQKKGG